MLLSQRNNVTPDKYSLDPSAKHLPLFTQVPRSWQALFWVWGHSCEQNRWRAELLSLVELSPVRTGSRWGRKTDSSRSLTAIPANFSRRTGSRENRHRVWDRGLTVQAQGPGGPPTGDWSGNGGPSGCPRESRPRRMRRKKQRLGGGIEPERRCKMASEVTGWAEELFTPMVGCGRDTAHLSHGGEDHVGWDGALRTVRACTESLYRCDVTTTVGGCEGARRCP